MQAFKGFRPSFVNKFDTNSTIANEATRLTEHRFAADLKTAPGTPCHLAAHDEIQERLPIGDFLEQCGAPVWVPTAHIRLNGITGERINPHSEHLKYRPGNLGKCSAFVLLPVPVGCQFGQAA